MGALAARQTGGKLLLQLTLLAGLALAGSVRLVAQSTLSQSDLSCAGFFTHRTIETGLSILSSEDGGFKNEFATGDYVYLNKGKDVVTVSGGQYTLIRPLTDVNRKEGFAGQRMLLRSLGTYYAEVGRIEVSVVHDQSATAKILMACDTIEVGDIAVPYNASTPPAFKSPHMTDRFAPSTGKATGLIATAKEYDVWLGEGKIVYLNLGSAQGVQVGSYFHVVRSYLGGGNAEFAAASRSFPTDMNGVQVGRKLTRAEIATMPREVIGEVMILKVEEGSSTGIITYSRSEIGVGDSVELE